MGVKDRFGQASATGATWQREGKPDPASVSARGITTRETLDWQAAKAPQTPAPEYHIDDPALRREAQEAVAEEHRATIERLRRAFEGRSAKARQDFVTARDYRGHGRER